MSNQISSSVCCCGVGFIQVCLACRAEYPCICKLDPCYRLAPCIVHAWTHNCSIWSRLSWQLLYSGFGRSGACVRLYVYVLEHDYCMYAWVGTVFVCVCRLCVSMLARVFRWEGTKERVRDINVGFPAVTPWLVLQWPCLPACLCVCGGAFACFHILWCSAGSASCAVLMLKLHAE